MVPKLRFKEFCGEWEEKRLGDVFTFIATNSFSRNDLNYIEGEIYNVHYGDIHMLYPTITDAQKEIFPYINKEKKLGVCPEILCKDGDVLLADASEDYDDIGKAIEIINVGDKKIVSGLHTIFIRDYKKIYANKFRGFMMNSDSVRKQIKVLAAGAKVLGISKSNITKVKIPLPSLSEQIKIADFLSTVDDKIQNQQDKITHLENIKKGFMQKIFSRKIRFKDDGGEEFPEWEEKKLGDVCTFKQGLQVPIEKQNYEFLDGMIRFIRIVDYTQQTTDLRYIYDNPKLKKVKKDDIVIVRYGANAGFIGKGIEGVIANNMFTITPINNIKKEYLYFYLRQDKIFENMNRGNSSSAMPALSFNQLSVVKIRYPCLKEQQKIADFLTSFDEKIFAEKEILEHLKQLKKGLLQQMFV